MKEKQHSLGPPWSDERILSVDRAHIWHPYCREKQLHEKRPPLVVRRAEGPYLYDSRGKAYLDGNGSWWCNLLGHRHPALIAALQAQLGELDHTALAGLTHESAARAAEALVSSSPKNLSRVFFSDNGSTAVETALKMAFQYSRNNGREERSCFVAIEGAFHGETLGCVSLSGSEVFHGSYGALRSSVIRIPSPASAGLEPAWDLAESILRRDAGRICAVIAEPLVQGACGMRTYPAEYLRRLRDLTRKLGILFIADEVFTGLGRTGSFWAVEAAGVEPDLLCSSKGLAGGMMPFAATLCSEEIYQAFYEEPAPAFFHGHTFAGNPLGAALAVRMIELVKAELPFLGARARDFAEEMQGFRSLKAVREIRTLGFIGVVELEGSGYLDEAGWRTYDRALELGLYARPLGNVLYLLPMLNLAGELRRDMVARLFQAASETLG